MPIGFISRSVFLRSALCLAMGASVTLSGCSSTPTTPTPSASAVKAQPVTQSARQLLERAQQSQSPEREQLILQAATVYWETDRPTRARNLLADLSPDELPDNLYVTYTQLLSSLALREGANFLAHSILTQPRLEQQWPHMSQAVERGIRQNRAHVFSLLGEPAQSVNERIELSRLLNTKKDRLENQEAIWQDLMSIPFAELQSLAQQETSEAARGWLELAVIGKNNQTDLEQQRLALEEWRRYWRNHPARDNLPSDLQLLESLIAQQPQHIALLLPLQGRLGEASNAVLDGFFAAYYHARQLGRTLPTIRQYDSSTDVISAYEQAVADGADLIIGPIDKERVTELSLLPSLSKPVLALNYPDQPVINHTNFYQLGLALEDEARQVARQAFVEGHRQAMVLIPQQEWAERSARAFTDEWEQLGGVVVSRSQFSSDGNYSGLVKGAMLIEQSQSRARELQDFLGVSLKTSPRSRSDVDMIFLIADPTQARQIKPTFAFHYAGNIPVFSTSQVYSGESNPVADRDLNGVRFTAMPWLFDTTSPEKKAVSANSKSAAVYGRLHALGADAFRVYARLPQLAQVPQMRIFGATGALKMKDGLRIEREQVWVRFRNGTPQQQSIVSDDSTAY